MIFSVAFFHGLDAAEVMRRFSRGEDSGQQSDFSGLNERVFEFVDLTRGGEGGGYVGAVQAGEWYVAIEPYGWWVTDHQVLTGCRTAVGWWR